MDKPYQGKLLLNEPLARYTSWRIGGPADRLYMPADKADLVAFLQHVDEGEAVFWLGLGSNVLIRDGGIRGTVINTKGRLKTMQLIDSATIYVEVGVPCAHVARFCTDLGLTGAEFMAGIPGTLGGALKMNAGAFGGETWSIVDTVEVVSRQGGVAERKKSQFDIAYRSIKGLADNEWFLSAVLQLQKGDPSSSIQKIKGLLEQRAETQPINKPTCGSVFKNPQGDYAARLIESCGLKGHQIGGACVSEKHANFIENRGDARAEDVEALIALIQSKVKEIHGVQLHTEVCTIGEPG